MSMAKLPVRGTVLPLRSQTTQDDFNGVMESWLTWFDVLTNQMNGETIPGINAVVTDFNAKLFPHMNTILQAGSNATAAAASATAAGKSAANAKTSETNAGTSAANAKAAETNAAASATNAASSKNAAAASATAAATSAANAKTSETNAAASATNAASSKTAAANSATAAANSAAGVKTAETNAASSATKAKTSETNAAASAVKAEAARDRCEEIEGALTGGATSLPTPNRLMTRDASGRSQVEDPSADKDIANKRYVAAHANLTSAHGAVSAATANRMVIRDASGRAQFANPSAAADAATKGYVDTHVALTAPHSATAAATANRLMLRDASGRAKVAAPSAAADIANKEYVDTAIVNATQSGRRYLFLPLAMQDSTGINAAVSIGHSDNYAVWWRGDGSSKIYGNWLSGSAQGSLSSFSSTSSVALRGANVISLLDNDTYVRYSKNNGSTWTNTAANYIGFAMGNDVDRMSLGPSMGIISPRAHNLATLVTCTSDVATWTKHTVTAGAYSVVAAGPYAYAVRGATAGYRFDTAGKSVALTLPVACNRIRACKNLVVAWSAGASQFCVSTDYGVSWAVRAYPFTIQDISVSGDVILVVSSASAFMPSRLNFSLDYGISWEHPQYPCPAPSWTLYKTASESGFFSFTNWGMVEQSSSDWSSFSVTYLLKFLE